MSDVVDDLRVAQANFLGIMPSHEFDEELLQGMRFRNHGQPHLLQKPRVAGDSPIGYFIRLLNLSARVKASDFCKSAKTIFPLKLERRTRPEVLPGQLL